MSIGGPLLILIGGLLGLCIAILAIIFVAVPILRGVGSAIGGVFWGIGYLIRHLFEYIFGTIGDAIRFVGGIPVFLVFGALSMLNVVVGRWSAAGHFANSASRECKIASGCVYRIVIRRPLRLLFLDGLLEGFEKRLPEAMEAAPGKDRPSRRTGQFDGYTIVGSLAGGGSGGKLYIAQPDAEKRAAIPTIPDRVVIKSFALSDGSSLPQIVRESRALECAKRLGHVIEHGMSESRFHYVMPYIPGEHLGLVARDLHGASDTTGLGRKQVSLTMDYLCDLLATLSAYHKGGFWHKDVKPENVIVHDGRAHLVDLGLVTALHSAMTLTTHGTEYFRDPEMVRQALRGVKVHQVDGARFDIFAVGAVLYFLLENTFPAHGGLSAFHKKSPEALHWIVRRAMAEYQQRYKTSDAMLADLHYVRSASDPWAVKPIELPSMRGAEIPETPVSMPDPVRVVSAGTPAPAAAEGVSGFGVAAGIGAAGAFAQVGRIDVDENGNPRAKAAGRRRPRLRITNWWTGAYEVEDAGSARDGASPVAAANAAFAATPVPPSIPMSPSRSAAEQIRAAGARVERARQRALTSRQRHPGFHKAVGERQPGPMMIILGAAMLGAVALLVAGMFTIRSGRNVVSVEGPGPAVFVINSHAAPTDPAVRSRIDAALREYRNQGFDVFEADSMTTESFGETLAEWWDNQSGPADDRLEQLMEAHNVYGILHVRGQGPRNTDITLVSSSSPKARARHRSTDESWLRVLVVNDAPEPDTTDISESIHELIRQQVGEANSLVQDTRLSQTIREMLDRLDRGDEQARDALESILGAQNARAAIWIQPDPEDDDAILPRVYLRGGSAFTNLLASEAPAPKGDGGRMLIVNNHPTIAHPDVIAAADSLSEFYREHGFEIIDDMNADAKARAALALSPMWDAEQQRTRLEPVMTEFELAAIVYIVAGPGEGHASERIHAALFEHEQDGETSASEREHASSSGE